MGRTSRWAVLPHRERDLGVRARSASKSAICVEANARSYTFRFASSFSRNELLSKFVDPTDVLMSSTIMILQWYVVGWSKRFLIRIGILRYPGAHVDHRFQDGDALRVESTVLTAHLTPGHTRRFASYKFAVRKGTRVLNVVSPCIPIELVGGRYAGYRSDFERTFRVLRALNANVRVTSHARNWGRYRKFVARQNAPDSVAPFIDRAGYRAYIDSGEARFRRGVVQ